jgi:CubicO group peptidase (beta-lactamase class C family)
VVYTYKSKRRLLLLAPMIMEFFVSANAPSHSYKPLQDRSLGQSWHWVLPLVLPLLISACSDGSSDSTQQPVAVVESPAVNDPPVAVVEPPAANDPPVAVVEPPAVDDPPVAVVEPPAVKEPPVEVVEPDYIEGQIIEALSASDQPVANAAVTLLFNGSTVQSDSEGRYRIELADELPIAQESLALSVSAEGYRPRELNVELNIENAIELAAQNAYQYFPPVQLDDGIDTRDLGDTNIDRALIDQLMQRFVQQDENLGYRQIHSLLIYKDGALILEEYNIGNDDFIRFEDDIARDSSRPAKQWTRTDKHYIASVNKALTSTVTGIALAEYGFQVDDKISVLLHEISSDFAEPNKAALSIHHMLTMQLGFTWDEWNSNDLALLWKSDDFTEFLLSRDNAGPGTAWVYNSASPNMLLRALDNTVDGGIRDWAHTHFYSKLGITDYDWVSQPDGIPEGAARMHMRPRDMLKVGITYLNNGVWNNEQLIPVNWVENVSKVQVATFAGDYSYFFWHRQINGVSYISADGDGGQYINIFPEQNMVIVMTQGNYLEWPLYVNQADDIMGNYILPAVAD